MPTLTQRALNRAVLARQGLLERHPSPLPQTLRRIGGIQAQYAPSSYVGLWSRMRSFAFEDLTTALERRSVVHATLQRGTIHLVHRRDFWPAREATREVMRRHSRRMTLPDGHLGLVAEAAEALREGPMARRELEALVGKPATRTLPFELDLVRVPPSSTWARPRADRWALAADWIGTSDSTPEKGLAELARSYLRGFGPASRHEIAPHCGVAVSAVTTALAGLELRSFEAEDGTPLLDLPRLPLPDPATPAPVRLLPTWDQTLIAHNRRAAVIVEADRGRIFSTRIPQSLPVFIVDGQAAGTWRRDGRTITTEPWGRLDAAVERELGEEVQRLEAALP